MDQRNQKKTEQKIQEWIDRLHLEAHPEGGWFSEVYAAPAEYGSSKDGRVMGGTIYFLLGKEDISHFHVIDCDEIWYFHEGCGVELWLLNPESKTAGCRRLYTLMSCATMPNFHYEGFRLTGQEELLRQFPKEEKLIREMAFAHTDGQKEL